MFHQASTKQQGLTSTPNVSYFLLNNFSVGLSTPLMFVKFSESRTMTYSIGPQVRYYVPVKSWAIFSEVNYTTGWYNFEGESFTSFGVVEDVKIDGRINSIMLGFGTTYFITKNVGLEGIIFYQRVESDYDDNFFNSDQTLSSINFKFGVQVYINNVE